MSSSSFDEWMQHTLWFLLAGEPRAGIGRSVDMVPGAGGSSSQDHFFFLQEAVHFDVTASLTVPLSRLILFGRPLPLVHMY